MDWLTFIATVIGSLAWPSAVVLLVLALRKPIKELLPLLQRVKYKEFELEFGRRVEEVGEEVARELPAETVAALPADGSSTFTRLAEISPRSAVLEAWADVELAALDAASVLGVKSIRSKTLTSQAIHLLEQQGSLSRNVINLLRDLRALRNKAAHAPDFALSIQSAFEYATSASAVARYLRGVARG